MYTCIFSDPRDSTLLNKIYYLDRWFQGVNDYAVGVDQPVLLGKHYIPIFNYLEGEGTISNIYKGLSWRAGHAQSRDLCSMGSSTQTNFNTLGNKDWNFINRLSEEYNTYGCHIHIATRHPSNSTGW